LGQFDQIARALSIAEKQGCAQRTPLWVKSRQTITGENPQLSALVQKRPFEARVGTTPAGAYGCGWLGKSGFNPPLSCADNGASRNLPSKAGCLSPPDTLIALALRLEMGLFRKPNELKGATLRGAKMSYSSENLFPASTRIADVREFVKLLGYEKAGVWTHKGQKFEDYGWFEQTDYKSWTSVELAIYKSDDGTLATSTRTGVSRSYYDLDQQNRTIRALYKRFGGTFDTDEGSRQLMRPETGPQPPASSGCHLAFARFGSNLITALIPNP
jgi:hypothetical protein